MKSWVRTGLIAVVIYLAIFTVNFFFLRTLSESLLMASVQGPVYILLQMFGLVKPGMFLGVGVIIYFCLGVGMDYAEGFWGKLRNKGGQGSKV